MEILNSRFSATSIGIAAVTLIILVTSLWVLTADDVPVSSELPTGIAERGSFDIYVIETATLDARQSVTLASDLPSNQAKVLELVPEGNLVHAGDIVARFDPAPFEDEIERIGKEVNEELTKLTQEETEQDLQESTFIERVDKLRLQVELAEISLNKLKEGDVPIRLARIERETRRAESDVENAARALKSQQQLYAEGFTTVRMLEEASKADEEARRAYEIVVQDADNVRGIEIPALLKRAQLEVENRHRELKSAERSLLQKRLQQDAGIRRTRSKLDTLAQELEIAKMNLASTKISTPVSGLVLYKPISFQNERRKVQVGDSLWIRHGFAVIPDMSSMVAYADIRESDVGKLDKGQSVTLQPEAYPDLRLNGEIESIGTLAADSFSGSDRTGSQNYFRVRIALSQTDPRLRPGMSARVSILARHFADAVRIPVEGVFIEDQEAVCFVMQSGSPRRQLLELGDSNGDYVVVKNGLQEGDRVLLVHPGSYDF